MGYEKPIQIDLFGQSPASAKPSIIDPISWTDFTQYQVCANQRFALQLVLNEDAPLPARRGFWFYSKVNRQRRTVAIDAFSEVIGRYLHAAYARRELIAVTE